MPPLEPPLKLRPETEASLLRRADKDLHQLSSHTMALVCVRAGMTLRKVPQNAWERSRDKDGYTVADVTCVCGKRPQIYPAIAPAQCEGCQRWFLYDTTDVWALNTPAGTD